MRRLPGVAMTQRWEVWRYLGRYWLERAHGRHQAIDMACVASFLATYEQAQSVLALMQGRMCP